MVRVKICGITNLDDALHAAECGADALGFVFFGKSPRNIEPEQAASIICQLPPYITPVGVFVDMDSGTVREVTARSGIRVLQLHGGETPDYCAGFGMPYYKAFRVRDMESLNQIEAYKDASAYLLDTYSEKEFGGTGVTFNWDVAVEARRLGRIILAGGLDTENVARGIKHVRPYAVDVSSGVESSPGRKDHVKVRQFIERAKAAR